MSKNVALPPWILDGYQPRFDKDVTLPSCDACQMLETAWGLIANASGGDWSKENEEWRVTAQRWRDEYNKVRHAARI